MPSEILKRIPLRVPGLDAARGLAMLLVCYAHFVSIYVGATGGEGAHGRYLPLLVMLGMVGGPLFFLISGTVLGYQADCRGIRFQVFRLKLVDRAAFLLTIGHAFMALVLAAYFGPARALRQGYITDTIALCILLGVWVIPAVGWRGRVILGLLVFGLATAAGQLWHPSQSILQFVKMTVLAPLQDGRTIFFFPVLPWFGLFLIGGGIGGWVQASYSARRGVDATRLLWIAAAMVGAAFAVGAVAFVAARNGGSQWAVLSHPMFAPRQKYPPGLVYMFLFGGSAVGALGLLLASAKHRWLTPVLDRAALVGRHSFPLFVVQFFLYYTLLFVLMSKGRWVTGALLYFPVSLWVLWIVAKFCDRYRMPRFLSLGLAPVHVERHDRRKSERGGIVRAED